MDDAKALQLAETYVELRRPERALEYVARCSPESARVWLLRARALEQLGKYGEAEEAVRRGLAIDPELGELYVVLAMSCWGRKDHRGAEEAVDEAVRLEPWNARFVALQALVLAQSGRTVEGTARMQEALELDPDERRLLFADAAVAMSRKDAEAADALTRELVAAEPELAESHALRALVLTGRNPREAVRHLREAARLDPATRAYARAARLASNPLLWLWRFTAPAGFYVAWNGMVAGILVVWVAEAKALLLTCIGLVVYYVAATFLVAWAQRPQ